jgi:hypothetical protein
MMLAATATAEPTDLPAADADFDGDESRGAIDWPASTHSFRGRAHRAKPLARTRAHPVEQWPPE